VTERLLHGARTLARRLAGRPAAPPRITPPTWKTVEHGPLAGLAFYLPGGRDAPWADRLIAGTYEPDMTAPLADLARHGGTLYDIGAHVGYYTAAWLRLGGTRVEAFEPVPSTRQGLAAMLARNGLADRVGVHDVALGCLAGQGAMQVDDADLGAASAAFLAGSAGLDSGLRLAPGHTARAVPVAVVRLDDYVRDKGLPPPTVIKLDVEGAEADVLAGAEAVLTIHRPAILCEVHRIDAGLELAAHLTRLGYTLRILGKNGPQPACLWTPASPRA
jgi:FkbM family methyltransferase